VFRRLGGVVVGGCRRRGPRREQGGTNTVVESTNSAILIVMNNKVFTTVHICCHLFRFWLYIHFMSVMSLKKVESTRPTLNQYLLIQLHPSPPRIYNASKHLAKLCRSINVRLASTCPRGSFDSMSVLSTRAVNLGSGVKDV
jgi:hypothetical protein